jgi:dihydroorotase
MKQIILNSPFDAHMHWRQKSTLLEKVAPYSMAQFSGGLLMPNTDPKIITIENLRWYRGEVQEIIDAHDNNFFPIFTLYLSADLDLNNIRIAWNAGLIHGIKYYPKGGTTASDKGLIGFREVSNILELMQELGIPLLIHGETPVLNGDVVDDYEREMVFIESELVSLVHEFPELRIVLEHITTTSAAQFVLAYNKLRATITPQHCLLDRRGLFNGVSFEGRQAKFDLAKNGINPSVMCRPILKHKDDLQGIQNALKQQAQKGLKKFGLGTDTAPHTYDKKYCECGACGVFSAPIALELYAMAFEEMDILDHLEIFACDVMPEFYGIKNLLPEKTVVLTPTIKHVSLKYANIVAPFAGMDIPWTAIAE